jgi:hypothetical protein
MVTVLEHRKAKLASPQEFRKRLLKFSLISALIFTVSLVIGVLGYHYLGRLGWVDSFMNASMILGGMGPVDPLPDNTAKMFAGVYALFCGVAFLLGMGIVITPIAHRFFHKFHADINDSEK